MSTPDWRNWIAGIVAAGGVAFAGWLTISISNLSGDTRALRGNCAHATWPCGSSEADGDNPWLELAERKMEDNT